MITTLLIITGALLALAFVGLNMVGGKATHEEIKRECARLREAAEQDRIYGNKPKP